MTLGRHASHLPHQACLGMALPVAASRGRGLGLGSAFVIPGGLLEIEEFLEEDSCCLPGPVCPHLPLGSGLAMALTVRRLGPPRGSCQPTWASAVW